MTLCVLVSIRVRILFPRNIYIADSCDRAIFLWLFSQLNTNVTQNNRWFCSTSYCRMDHRSINWCNTDCLLHERGQRLCTMCQYSAHNVTDNHYKKNVSSTVNFSLLLQNQHDFSSCVLHFIKYNKTGLEDKKISYCL